MTTFIFVSGYLAKNPKTNVKNLINLSLLYLTFNTIFRLIFSRNFTLAPFWTLWYLEALIVYRIILIFINKLKKNKKIKDNVFNVIMVFFIICSILISLFGVTHFTTNSIFNIKTPDIKVIKISMYLPIFFMGYMLSKDNLKKLKEFVDKSVIGNVLVVLGIIITSIFCVKYFNNIGIHYLYVNEGYKQWNITLNQMAFSRFAAYITGICFSIVVLRIASEKKIKILDNMGENSLCIFILHTAIVKILRIMISEKIINIPAEYELYYLIIMIILTLLISSNKYVTGLFNKYSSFIKK